MLMNTRAHVWISGHVQGVLFRHSVMKLAERLGICGWVRNLPDGRVEAVFEGGEPEVNRMVEFCRRGPDGAHVTGMQVQKEKFTKEFSGFDIIY